MHLAVGAATRRRPLEIWVQIGRSGRPYTKCRKIRLPSFPFGERNQQQHHRTVGPQPSSSIRSPKPYRQCGAICGAGEGPTSRSPQLFFLGTQPSHGPRNQLPQLAGKKPTQPVNFRAGRLLLPQRSSRRDAHEGRGMFFRGTYHSPPTTQFSCPLRRRPNGDMTHGSCHLDELIVLEDSLLWHVAKRQNGDRIATGTLPRTRSCGGRAELFLSEPLRISSAAGL